MISPKPPVMTTLGAECAAGAVAAEGVKRFHAPGSAPSNFGMALESAAATAALFEKAGAQNTGPKTEISVPTPIIPPARTGTAGTGIAGTGIAPPLLTSLTLATTARSATPDFAKLPGKTPAATATLAEPASPIPDPMPDRIDLKPPAGVEGHAVIPPPEHARNPSSAPLPLGTPATEVAQAEASFTSATPPAAGNETAPETIQQPVSLGPPTVDLAQAQEPRVETATSKAERLQPTLSAKLKLALPATPENNQSATPVSTGMPARPNEIPSANLLANEFASQLQTTPGNAMPRPGRQAGVSIRNTAPTEPEPLGPASAPPTSESPVRPTANATSPTSLLTPAIASSLPSLPANTDKLIETNAITPRMAVQIVQPIISILTSSSQASGEQQVVIRLDPQELGKIQITVERTGEGSARVSLMVERPETLALFQRDQPQLYKALERAGIQADGHSIGFNLLSLSPSDGADGATPPPDATNSGFPQLSSGMSQDQQRRPAPDPGGERRDPGAVSWAQFDPAPSYSSARHVSTKSNRAGVDITA